MLDILVLCVGTELVATTSMQLPVHHANTSSGDKPKKAWCVHMVLFLILRKIFKLAQFYNKIFTLFNWQNSKTTK